MSTEQNAQPSKISRGGKSCAKTGKTITKIDLDKDKPFSWEEFAEKYGNCPPSEIPEFEPPQRCEHEDARTVCITIPNIFVRDLPHEFEIRLKYKDEEVRITGNSGSVICNNIQKANQPVLKLALEALSYTEELNAVYQPCKEKAA